MAIKDENGKVTGWSFAILDRTHVASPSLLASKTYEMPSISDNMAKIGWSNVRFRCQLAKGEGKT